MPMTEKVAEKYNSFSNAHQKLGFGHLKPSTQKLMHLTQRCGKSIEKQLSTIITYIKHSIVDQNSEDAYSEEQYLDIFSAAGRADALKGQSNIFKQNKSLTFR